MNKKQISAVVFVCVLGVIALVFLYLIGFFDGGDDSLDREPQNTSAAVLTETTLQSEETEKTTEGETHTSITENELVAEKTAESDITETPKPFEETEYKFRNKNLLNQHYEKHGKDMGFENAEEYEKAASAVVNNPDALHKIEAEDGDDVYYVESTNEFVVVAKDGYIRTYFLPDRGIDYFNKQ